MPLPNYVPPNTDGIINEPIGFASKKQRDVEEHNNSTVDLLRYGLPAAAIGAFDDIAQSVTPDSVVDENTVLEMFDDTTSGLGQYYKNNREGAQTVGAIASSFVPIMGAMKLVKGGAYLDRLLSKGGKTSQWLKKAVITSGKSRLDRAMQINAEAAVLIPKSKILSMSDDGTQEIYRQMNHHKWEAVADIAKESLAADLAIVGLYNDSDVFFPEDLSALTNAALFLVPDALLSGLAYRFTSTAIKKQLMDLGTPDNPGLPVLLEESLNPKGMPETLALAYEGQRGPAVAMHGMQAHQARLDQAQAVDTELAISGGARLEAAKEAMSDWIVRMFKDNPHQKGVTHAFTLDKDAGQVQNLLKWVEEDPSFIVPVVSAERLSSRSQETYFKNIKKWGDDVESKLSTQRVIANNKALNDLQRIQARDEISKLTDERKLIERLQDPVVLETDGTITPLKDRRWSWTDSPDSLRTDRTTDAGESILKLTKGQAADADIEMGVTARGKLLVQPLKVEKKNTALGGVPTVQIFTSPTSQVIEREFREKMSLNLHAAGRDWHYAKGEYGREVFETLPHEQQSALSAWVGSSSSGKIRQWGSDHPFIQELTQAYRERGFERQMHEVADDQGRVLLYRGTHVRETASPQYDIVSVSTNPKIAQEFAKQHGKDGIVLKMMVPVEDILFPVGGAGDEFEFVIKNQIHRMQARQPGQEFVEAAVGNVQEEAITAMTWDQRSAAFVLFQEQLNNFEPAVHGKTVIHPSSSWIELDFATQLMRKFPDSHVVDMAAGGQVGQPAFRDLVFETLSHKFEELQRLELIRYRNEAGILNLEGKQALSYLDNARILNLPTGTSGGLHPLLQVFKELMPQQGGEIRNLRSFFNSLDEIDEAMVRHVAEGRLGEDLATDLKYWGNMLTSDYDEALRPSLLVQQGRTQRFGPDEIALRIIANKAWQQQMFADAGKKAPFVAGIVEEFLNHPDELAIAARPDLILEITPVNRGVFGQQSQTYIGNPVLENLDRLIDLADKRALNLVNEMFRKHNDTFNKIFTQNNEPSLDLVNNGINSIRQGWRILKAPDEFEKGRYMLFLDTEDTFNQQHYKRLFGRDLIADAKLSESKQVPVPVRASTVEGSGDMPTPLVLDKLALDGLAAITEMSHQFLDNLNYLRNIRHLKPIPKKDWHIPPVNMQKGTTVYLVDGSGTVKGFVNRPTEGDAWRAAYKEADDSKVDGRDLIPKAEDTVMRYHDTIGDVWQDARNFQYSEFQTGRAGGKGGGVAIETGQAPLKELIESIQSNFSLLGRHTRATFFESEMNYSRSMITANAHVGKTKKLAKMTNWQRFEDIILQRPALNPNGWVGKFYYSVESVADDIMRNIWDHKHSIKPQTLASTEKDFERVQKYLGDYNPFKDVEDMMRKTTQTYVPPNLRKTVSKLNGFTTDMVLRIFDMGMPLINFASLLSVTPAVMNAMRRGPGESKQAWLSRIGAVGSPIDDNFAMPNTGRMMMNGISSFFDEEARAVRKLAAERGYLHQEVAERLNLWTRPKEGYLKSTLDKAVDFLSVPTDWSENMSRAIAFQMAYNVGRRTLKLQQEQAMSYAHIHANRIIGDFRPNNRPQMFQGAAGMPLGLFTTWAINWLQRVFGDLEAGRLGAVGWQAAVQQFLFGAGSLPGVSAFIENFTSSYDGRKYVTDAMDEMYGREFTDWFMHGTLASLTGVAVQSRADVSLPAIMTGEKWSTAVPSFSVMSTLYEGLAESFKSLRENGGYNPREMTEIISVYGVNGAVRNLAQIIQGQVVDRRGATINAHVREFESILPRMFELKSMRETRKAKEVYRDRMQDITERGHLDRLRKRLRSAVRGQNVDGELLNEALMDYVKAGGSPEYFRRFLKEQILVAQYDVATRLLLRAMRANDEQGQAMRLMNVLMER